MKSQIDSVAFAMLDDDDDFQSPTQILPLTQTTSRSRSKTHSSSRKHSSSQPPPLKPSNSKKPKRSHNPLPGKGKENMPPPIHPMPVQKMCPDLSDLSQVCETQKELNSDEDCGLSSVKSTFDCSLRACDGSSNKGDSVCFEEGIHKNESYICNSIESRLFDSGVDCKFDVGDASLDKKGMKSKEDLDCILGACDGSSNEGNNGEGFDEKRLKSKQGYLCNSIESRLLNSRVDCNFDAGDENLDEDALDEFEPGSQLDVLLKLCSGMEEEDSSNYQQATNCLDDDSSVPCPLCGVDISHLNEEFRHIHTNECLDRGDAQNVVLPSDDPGPQFPPQVVDGSPVIDWLRGLGLAKYEEAFVREEIDWDTLQWLTEEDLFSIGVTALGPRKKIVHALSELRKGTTLAAEIPEDERGHSNLRKASSNGVEINRDASTVLVDGTSKLAANKLITDYFPGSATDRNKACTTSRGLHVAEKSQSGSRQKRSVEKNHVKNGKARDVPSWCCITGTPFRVDAFRYLRRDCSHWFLTHFHTDHYQGLTRSFSHGKIYCSSITAKLVSTKIGILWDKIEVLPLNQKINIAGISVTCLDANHCPGSIIILFEPPNGEAILHTGDFRFSEEMTSMSVLQTCRIHTLILDTTYCNPQYDFPKQEAVIQFVIEAIQAEAFNPNTLFLIGSYTIGKERLFLEVARVLRKKVYINAAKMHILKCLGFPEEDMQWFTVNEGESHIHVVPMWTLASFKRLKHISNQYASRFNLIVAFSPTGWTFGKGKKSKSPGRRWQQGTVIRYEVPYSEHSSFTELKEFVKFISPVNIVPSVNNDGPESAHRMRSLLLS